jgi:SPX domain protein involved in polyphosphate accumulation
VLHSVLRRMVFAMPFDDRIRITIDTDVTTRALVSPTASHVCHRYALKQHLLLRPS